MSGAMPVEPQRLKRRVVPREFLGSTAERISARGLPPKKRAKQDNTASGPSRHRAQRI